MVLGRVGLGLTRNLRAAGIALGLTAAALAVGGCHRSKAQPQSESKTVIYDRELLPVIESKKTLGLERCNGSEPLTALKLDDKLKDGQTLAVTLARIVLEREQGDKFTSLPIIKQILAVNYLTEKIGSGNLLDKLTDYQKDAYKEYCKTRESGLRATTGEFPRSIELFDKDEIDKAMAAAGVVKTSGQQPTAVAYKIVKVSPAAPVPVELNNDKEITLIVSNNLLDAYKDQTKLSIDAGSKVGVSKLDIKYCEPKQCPPTDGMDVSNHTLVTFKVKPDSGAEPGTRTIVLNFGDPSDKKPIDSKKDAIKVIGPSAPTASASAKTPPTATATADKTPPQPTVTATADKTPPVTTTTKKQRCAPGDTSEKCNF